ncbi:MAG TPA: hypothetical protein VGE52_04265 [Pirellulales bacterium]
MPSKLWRSTGGKLLRSAAGKALRCEDCPCGDPPDPPPCGYCTRGFGPTFTSEILYWLVQWNGGANLIQTGNCPQDADCVGWCTFPNGDYVVSPAMTSGFCGWTFGYDAVQPTSCTADTVMQHRIRVGWNPSSAILTPQEPGQLTCLFETRGPCLMQANFRKIFSGSCVLQHGVSHSLTLFGHGFGFCATVNPVPPVVVTPFMV